MKTSLALSAVATAALISVAPIVSPDSPTGDRGSRAADPVGATMSPIVERIGADGQSYIAGPTGWHGDVIAEWRLAEEIGAVRANQAIPLTGAWQRLVDQGIYYRLLFLYERAAFGADRPPQYQTRGTCVSRGTAGAIDASIGYSVARTGLISRPVRIDFATIYAGSRVDIGGGQLGRSDGSFGSWAAVWLAKNGAIPRAVYAGVNTEDERAAEAWAVAHGNPGTGVPPEIMQEAASRQDRVEVRCMLCDTLEECADAVAIGCGLSCCTPVIWGDRDSNGMAKVAGSGGHCVECCGVFLTPQKKLAFVMRQSWGAGVPRGPRTLRTLSGDFELPDGCYGVDAAEWWRYANPNSGVVWAFQLTRGFPAATIAGYKIGISSADAVVRELRRFEFAKTEMSP